ncbi:MAG: hypothetical protein PHS41_05325 [Victivallaceae bacterium]|nr:hypothetical protein [Victivallaceae bacterium]
MRSIAVFLLLLACAVALAWEEPARMPDAVTLRQGDFKAVISPSLGRVIGLSKGETQFLVFHALPTEASRRKGETQLVSYGGSRLWTHFCSAAMRPVFGRDWPPDPTFDHGIWQAVGSTDSRIVLRSPVSEKLGLQAERTIFLAGANTLRIQEKVTRVKKGALHALIWSIAEVRLPDFFLLHGKGLYCGYGRKKEDASIEKISGDCVKIKFGKESDLWNLGCLGGDWTCAVYDRHALVQSHGREGNPVLFADRKNRIAEMESITLPTALPAGDRLEMTIELKVIPFPGALSDDEKIAVIRKQLE